MTQSISGSNTQRSAGFPALNFGLKFFPILFTGTAGRFAAARPRAFTFLSGALSFFSGLSLLKISDLFSDKLTKKLKKDPFQKTTPKQPTAQAEEPIRLETKPIPVQETPVVSAPQVSIPKKQGVRTWSDRREQLLNHKI